MPWCPNCKAEYVNGVKVCADCGHELVDSLDSSSVTEDSDSNSEGILLDEIKQDLTNNDTTDNIDKKLSGLAGYNELEMKKAAEDFINRPSAVYVKKADKYEDLKSTTSTFLVFGVCGLIFVALNLLGVISFLNGILSLIVMTILFIIFIAIGINSYITSKTIKTQIENEENVTVQIKEWLKNNMTKEELDTIHNPSEPDEVNFFHKIEYMKGKVSEIHPNVSEAYLDQLVEEFYNDNF
ncbi:hypothetical protein [Anaeromicropila herbilytica]|uniref:Uncharacterized protein n=1 Tax=Anaeromicropila herbilytica TaxID=2785025 RepID=A0A7R7EKY2_9FIRM|nr:hypothetical protein [Anaeromicropila herbilytica]BCN30687.1 hypothetical protein bsdtb5_19820 [Anaeromicropila herbilytica]